MDTDVDHLWARRHEVLYRVELSALIRSYNGWRKQGLIKRRP